MYSMAFLCGFAKIENTERKCIQKVTKTDDTIPRLWHRQRSTDLPCHLKGLLSTDYYLMKGENNTTTLSTTKSVDYTVNEFFEYCFSMQWTPPIKLYSPIRLSESKNKTICMEIRRQVSENVFLFRLSQLASPPHWSTLKYRNNYLMDCYEILVQIFMVRRWWRLDPQTLLLLHIPQDEL